MSETEKVEITTSQNYMPEDVSTEITTSCISIDRVSLESSTRNSESDDECVTSEVSESVFKNVGSFNGNTEINVKNSSDVIIGPVTQYHGPVKIYQNVTCNKVKLNESANGVNLYPSSKWYVLLQLLRI